MVKRLSKYGNSLALIIDKPILELLNIREDTPLKISTDGKTIIITPGDGDEIEPKKKRIQKQAETIIEEVIEEYSEALEKLAKN